MDTHQPHAHRYLLLAGLALLLASLAVAGCAMGPSARPPAAGSGNVTSTTSPSAVDDQVRALTGTIDVDTATRQIRYTSQQVTLIVVGSPPGHEGEYWQVDGLVDPEIIVPAGAHITVKVVNGDPDMPHGWVLTTSAPPYGQMPMMNSGYGGMAPMASYAMVPPLPETHGNQWPMTTISFTAPPAGTYYYICQVPDHAQEGMWGTLMVQ